MRPGGWLAGRLAGGDRRRAAAGEGPAPGEGGAAVGALLAKAAGQDGPQRGGWLADGLWQVVEQVGDAHAGTIRRQPISGSASN
jgi:hypothetical protein